MRKFEKSEKLVELCFCHAAGAQIIKLQELGQQRTNDARHIGLQIRDFLSAHPDAYLVAQAASPGPSTQHQLSLAAGGSSGVELKSYKFYPGSGVDPITLVDHGERLSLDGDEYNHIGISRRITRPNPRLVLINWTVGDDPQRVNLILHPKSGTAHIGKISRR